MHRFFTILLALATAATALAQVGTYNSSDNTATATIAASADGKTLTITGHGDLSAITGSATVYHFTQAAVNDVYPTSEQWGQSVNSGDEFSPAATYYKTLATPQNVAIDFGGGTILESSYVNSWDKRTSRWNTEKATQAPIYTFRGSEGSYGVNIVDVNNAQVPAAGATNYCVEDAAGTITATYNNEQKAFRQLSQAELEGYVVACNQYRARVNLKYSTDGGATMHDLYAWTWHEYNADEVFYEQVYREPWNPYATAASQSLTDYFLDTSRAYIAGTQTSVGFSAFLANAVAGGEYETIEFKLDDDSQTLTLTPDLVRATLFPGGAANAHMTMLDLTDATLSTAQMAFAVSANWDAPKNTVLTTLRMPKTITTWPTDNDNTYKTIDLASLTALQNLNIKAMNLTDDKLHFFHRDASTAINVLDKDNVTLEGLNTRYDIGYEHHFNAYSENTLGTSGATEMDVFVTDVDNLDLTRFGSNHANLVIDCNDGTKIGSQAAINTLLTKVNAVTGVHNLVLSKLQHNYALTDISALTNTEIKRVILPDHTAYGSPDLNAITTAATHTPILQIYNQNDHKETIKSPRGGALNEIADYHYFSQDIDHAYWQEYIGNIDASDLSFLGGIRNEHLDLGNATYPQDDASLEALHHYSNQYVKYMAFPDLGHLPADPLYTDVFSNCPQMVAVGQYVGSLNALNACSREEGAMRYITEMLAARTGNNSNIKRLKLSGTLSAEDLFVAGNDVEIDADGHLYFNEPVDEYDDKQIRTINSAHTTGGTPLTSGALDGLGKKLESLDLSDATFSNEDDITISYLNINAEVLTELCLPRTLTKIPADMLKVNGCPLKEICIPGSVQEIHARAFKNQDLIHVYTTQGTETPAKPMAYDYGATYKDAAGDVHKIEGGEAVPEGYTPFYGTMTLPYGLTFIGSHAFAGAEHLHDVYMLNQQAPECNVNAFSSITHTANNSYQTAYITEKGQVDRDAYQNNPQNATFMAVLHFPKECYKTDAAKLYTDVTREYNIPSTQTDDLGHVVYYPTQAQWCRAYQQGTTGYLWRAFCTKSNSYSQSAQGYYLNSSDAAMPELGFNHTDQAISNYVYTANDYNPDKASCVFYDTYSAAGSYGGKTYPEYAALPYNTTLYDHDYRGWHQFVLTEYTNTAADKETVIDPSDISDSNWWTICEPFPLTAAELRHAYGNNVRLVKLVSVTRDASASTITLNFGVNLLDAGDVVRTDLDEGGAYTLHAGVPYMIKPALPPDWTPSQRAIVYSKSEASANLERFNPKTTTELKDLLEKGWVTVPAYVVNPTAGVDEPYTEENGKNVHSALTYTMLGSVTYSWYLPKYCYFLGWDGDKGQPAFYWKTAVDYNNLSWNPNTAIIAPNFVDLGFHMPQGLENGHYEYDSNDAIGVNDDIGAVGGSSGTAKGRGSIAMRFDCDEPPHSVTAIRAVAAPTRHAVYSLSGQRIAEGAALRKGIYITDGKKHIER